MPATAVVVVAGELKVGGGRLQGRGGVRRRRGGARGPADQFALRELNRGKSNSLSAPFYPEKCSATVRYLARSSRPSRSPRTIGKSVRTEKSGALSLLLERRLRRGSLPGKEIGSNYTRTYYVISIRDQRSVRNPTRTISVSVACKRRWYH